MKILFPFLLLSSTLAVDKQIAWRFGASYPDENLSVGDSITFVWQPFHNVWLFDNNECQENGNSVQLAPPTASRYTYTIQPEDAGRTLDFVCEVGGHCNSGQQVRVIVRSAEAPSGPPNTLPTSSPSMAPTLPPTPAPTSAAPSPPPTVVPTVAPTLSPTPAPTSAAPSPPPTAPPTVDPTLSSTITPTPSLAPFGQTGTSPPPSLSPASGSSGTLVSVQSAILILFGLTVVL